MSLKEYIFLNVSTHTLYLNQPFGVNMEHLYLLFKEISEKQNPEESEDPQIVNPRVWKVVISQGTPGFGVFEEPLAIPSLLHVMIKISATSLNAHSSNTLNFSNYQ